MNRAQSSSTRRRSTKSRKESSRRSPRRLGVAKREGVAPVGTRGRAWRRCTSNTTARSLANRDREDKEWRSLMPEMHFLVRWPDGHDQRCYSPSLVVREHLEVGRSYEVAGFVERSRTLLTIASER